MNYRKYNSINYTFPQLKRVHIKVNIYPFQEGRY